MRKQIFNRTKKILGILMVVFFVASVTATAVSAYFVAEQPVFVQPVVEEQPIFVQPVVEGQPIVVGGYGDGYYGDGYWDHYHHLHHHRHHHHHHPY